MSQFLAIHGKQSYDYKGLRFCSEKDDPTKDRCRRGRTGSVCCGQRARWYVGRSTGRLPAVMNTLPRVCVGCASG